MSLNLKQKKLFKRAEVKTLDELHKEYVDKFSNDKVTMPNKINKLNMLKDKLNLLQKKDPNKYTNDDVKQKASLQTEIKEMEKEIYHIDNNKNEIDYYFKTCDIIMDYYDTFDNSASKDDGTYIAKTHPTETKSLTKKPPLTKLQKINLKQKKNRKYKKVTKKRKPTIQSKNTIMSFLGNTPTQTSDTKSSNKADMLNQFKIFTNDKTQRSNKKISPIKTCINCDIEKISNQTDGTHVCPNCGDAENSIMEYEKPNSKDPIPEKPGYPYKKINHYNELLSQIQGKESTEIPEEICNKVMAELHKEIFYDIKKLNKDKVKKILKKIGHTSYYEHAINIISKIKKKRPDQIDRKTDKEFLSMFKQIQKPYEKHRPKNRVNFFSYNYILHKFCELKEMDEYAKKFKLLKSVEKLRIQDQIWKKVCKDLRWQYIPSI